MKWFILVIAATLALAGYLYFNPELRSRWFEGTPLASEPVQTPLYQWQDATGQWQVSDRPPPAGVPYRTLKYRSDVNVLPLAPQLREED